VGPSSSDGLLAAGRATHRRSASETARGGARSRINRAVANRENYSGFDACPTCARSDDGSGRSCDLRAIPRSAGVPTSTERLSRRAESASGAQTCSTELGGDSCSVYRHPGLEELVSPAGKRLFRLSVLELGGDRGQTQRTDDPRCTDIPWSRGRALDPVV
jgi:hypothetical protein